MHRSVGWWVTAEGCACWDLGAHHRRRGACRISTGRRACRRGSSPVAFTVARLEGVGSRLAWLSGQVSRRSRTMSGGSGPAPVKPLLALVSCFAMRGLWRKCAHQHHCSRVDRAGLLNGPAGQVPVPAGVDDSGLGCGPARGACPTFSHNGWQACGCNLGVGRPATSPTVCGSVQQLGGALPHCR